MNSKTEKMYQRMFPETYEKREKIMASLASINSKYKKPSFLSEKFSENIVDIEKIEQSKKQLDL